MKTEVLQCFQFFLVDFGMIRKFVFIVVAKQKILKYFILVIHPNAVHNETWKMLTYHREDKGNEMIQPAC